MLIPKNSEKMAARGSFVSLLRDIVGKYAHQVEKRSFWVVFVGRCGMQSRKVA